MRYSFVNEKEGVRLDVFVKENMPDCSRRMATYSCSLGLVRVNGRQERGGSLLSEGDVVEVAPIFLEARARPELAETHGGAQKFINVFYEDEHLLVIEKPREMHTVTHSVHDPLTLADCLAAYCTATLEASPDPRESGLAQRLDFYTSGLVLAAKRSEVWESLREALSRGAVKKTYLALVEGKPTKNNFSINYELEQSKNSKKMKIAREGALDGRGLSAETHVRRIGLYLPPGQTEPYSVVRAEMNRGRRHQIRVHLSETGNPLVGDKLYGARTSLEAVLGEEVLEGEKPEGFLLHAESIEMEHPVTGEPLTVHKGLQYFETIMEHTK